MSEMVERVARALYMNRRSVPFPNWETEIEVERNYFRSAAHAAIEAMREPTVGMVDKALIVTLKPSADRERLTFLYDYEAREIWQMQIDEALK